MDRIEIHGTCYELDTSVGSHHRHMEVAFVDKLRNKKKNQITLIVNIF